MASTTFEQEVCSTKVGYENTLSLGTNSCKNRNVATLNSAAHIQQKRPVTCVAGQNDSRALYIASSESCQPERNLFRVGTKLKESIFKNNNQINSTVTTRTWLLPTEWIRTWPNTGLVFEWKNGRWNIYHSNKWYPFVWMVDVVLQGAWVLYCINWDKGDESLPLLAFRRYVINAIFWEYSNEGKLFRSHTVIRNIPSDLCYDDTKLICNLNAGVCRTSSSI